MDYKPAKYFCAPIIMETELTPETDQQELWELAGRIKATLRYIEHDEYANREVIYFMLSGEKLRREAAE